MKIFHIIDSLGRGGAETLLLGLVKNLAGHKNYLITLSSINQFDKEETGEIELICLNFKSFVSVPLVVYKLRKLIALHKPDVLHAHLPLATFIARLSRPAGMKLFVSIHNNYSQSLKQANKKLFYLERKLHSSGDELIFVSSAAKQDYDKIIGIKGKAHILHNFIRGKFMGNGHLAGHSHFPTGKSSLRMVSVGNLKYQKNFDTLIRAFALLDGSRYSLDIYGDGPERNRLLEMIDEQGLKNVKIKGAVDNIEDVLPSYDAFILASRFEGFGIAPLEAAALGLPLLLSDIDVFHEITKDNAIFFAPEDPNDIAEKLKGFVTGTDAGKEKAILLQTVVKQKYSLHTYIEQLLKIYSS